MVTGCCVKSCRKRQVRGSGRRFYRFPLRRPALLAKWIAAVQKPGLAPTRHTFICSEHFTDDCFRIYRFNKHYLKEDAVPTIFDGPSSLLAAEIPWNLEQQVELQPEAATREPEKVVEPLTREPKKVVKSATGVLEMVVEPDTGEPEKVVEPVTIEPGMVVNRHALLLPRIQIEHAYQMPDNPRLMRERLSQEQVNYRHTKTLLRSAQQCILRRDKKLASLNNKMLELKNRSDINKRARILIEESFGQDTLLSDIIKSQLDGKSGNYSDVVKSFAVTLHCYSAQAYDFVRRSLMNCLPHKSTLSTWTSEAVGKKSRVTAEVVESSQSEETIGSKVSSNQQYECPTSGQNTLPPCGIDTLPPCGKLPSGERDTLLPGERDTLLPGERDTLLPGERDILLPGERDTKLPGERGTSLPGERDTLPTREQDAVPLIEHDTLHPIKQETLHVSEQYDRPLDKHDTLLPVERELLPPRKQEALPHVGTAANAASADRAWRNSKVKIAQIIYRCHFKGCTQMFKVSDLLQKHLYKEHRGRLLRCNYVNAAGVRCEKEFAADHALRAHTRTHYNDRLFKCSYVLTSKSGISLSQGQQQILVGGVACSKSFKSPARLRQHIQTHTEERPYICNEDGCGKAYKSSNSLRIHERSHSGERPYQCTSPGCQKSFSSVTNYNNHLRIHSGAKPFTCSVEGCGKSFTEYSTLFKHCKTHTRTGSKNNQ